MIVSTEREGRHYKVRVPDDAPESTWRYGILVGPPDLSGLGLPSDTEARLHDELFNRGLIEEKDIRKRAHELTAALQAALSVDVNRLMEAYHNARHS